MKFQERRKTFQSTELHRMLEIWKGCIKYTKYGVSWYACSVTQWYGRFYVKKLMKKILFLFFWLVFSRRITSYSGHPTFFLKAFIFLIRWKTVQVQKITFWYIWKSSSSFKSETNVLVCLADQTLLINFSTARPLFQFRYFSRVPNFRLVPIFS